MRIFQPIITGSFTVSGSVFFPTLVTSSTAVTNVVMFGTNGELFTTASTAIGGGGAGFPYTGDAVISGSLLVSGSGLTVTGSLNASAITGSLHGTASWASNTITAQTASFANSFTIGNGGTLALNGTLTDSSTINSTIVGSNNLFQQATGSYTSAHGKYTLHNGTNARAGEFITVWNGNSVEYYDNSTNDIGNTEDITFQSLIVTGQIQINAVAASSGWTVKMLITYI
jgi:hypothetical protein